MDNGTGASGGGGGGGDDMSRIFSLIRDAAVSASSTSLSFKDVEAIVLKKGFSLDKFHRTLEEYQELNVLNIDPARTRIDFVG